MLVYCNIYLLTVVTVAALQEKSKWCCTLSFIFITVVVLSASSEHYVQLIFLMSVPQRSYGAECNINLNLKTSVKLISPEQKFPKILRFGFRPLSAFLM